MAINPFLIHVALDGRPGTWKQASNSEKLKTKGQLEKILGTSQLIGSKVGRISNKTVMSG